MQMTYWMLALCTRNLVSEIILFFLLPLSLDVISFIQLKNGASSCRQMIVLVTIGHILGHLHIITLWVTRCERENNTLILSTWHVILLADEAASTATPTVESIYIRTVYSEIGSIEKENTQNTASSSTTFGESLFSHSLHLGESTQLSAVCVCTLWMRRYNFVSPDS